MSIQITNPKYLAKSEKSRSYELPLSFAFEEHTKAKCHTIKICTEHDAETFVSSRLECLKFESLNRNFYVAGCFLFVRKQVFPDHHFIILSENTFQFLVLVRSQDINLDLGEIQDQSVKN